MRYLFTHIVFVFEYVILVNVWPWAKMLRHGGWCMGIILFYHLFDEMIIPLWFACCFKFPCYLEM